MVPKIKKILYATDLSENARYAFGYAADMAQRHDAAITILYVMEEFNHMMETYIKDMIGLEEWERLQSEKMDYPTQKIKERLDDFCMEMDAEIDSCRLLIEDIKIKRGNPTKEILNTATNIQADIIVIGSYGHNILQGALIGGTARRVVKNSKTPVLVVRLPKK